MNSKVNIDMNKSDDVSLKDLFLKMKNWRNYLLSKWLVFVLVGALGGIAGYFYAASVKPVYLAKTTFVLEESTSGGGLAGLGGIASMAGLDLGGGTSGGIFQGDNILELYKSRSMIQKTLLTEVNINGKKKLLIDQYVDMNELRETWKENSRLKNVKFLKLGFQRDSADISAIRLQDSLLGHFVNDINENYLDVSKPDKKLNLIQANVKSKNEYFSKLFNDEIVKNVNDFYLQTKTKKSLDNVKILQVKTDSVRAEMEGSIYRAASVSDATPNLNPTRQLQRVVPMQRSQFNMEANKEILSELVKNLELSKITLRKEAPLIQVVDEPIFPLQKIQLGRIKAVMIGSLLFGVFAFLFFTIKMMVTDTN